MLSSSLHGKALLRIAALGWAPALVGCTLGDDDDVIVIDDDSVSDDDTEIPDDDTSFDLDICGEFTDPAFPAEWRPTFCQQGRAALDTEKQAVAFGVEGYYEWQDPSVEDPSCRLEYEFFGAIHDAGGGYTPACDGCTYTFEVQYEVTSEEGTGCAYEYEPQVNAPLTLAYYSSVPDAETGASFPYGFLTYYDPAEHQFRRWGFATVLSEAELRYFFYSPIPPL